MRILLLCDYRPGGASTVLDHIHALEQYSGHGVYRLSVLGDIPDRIDLNCFDAVIVHYSLVISSDAYLSPLARYRLRRFEGLKAVFIQDEYRWVNRTVDALRYLRAQVLFTCVPDAEIEKVYPEERLPGLAKFNVLTGYVPERLIGLQLPAYGQRPIDVGYRGRRISAAYGELGCEKWRIADRFRATVERFGLRCDISYDENDRLYGSAWVAFIQSCKAMLGVESGASVFDWTGEIIPAVMAREDRDPLANFELLRDRYFPDADGLITMNQISPRCFECAALGTLMILYEGAYSGILVPWRHYVPLRKDHANDEEVVAALRDETTWRRITEQAYDEVALDPNLSFRAFAQRVGEILREQARRLPWRATGATLELRDFEHIAEGAATAARLQSARTESRSEWYLRFRRHVLGPSPRPFALAIEGLVRHGYRTFRNALDGIHALRRLLNATGDPRILFWWIVDIRPKRFHLMDDLDLLLRLRRYGQDARAVTGISQFRLLYQPARRTLCIVPADRLRAGERESGGAQLRDALANALMEEAPSRLIVMLDDEECRDLAVRGIEERSLEGLASLVRRCPRLGTRLIVGDGGEPAWLDELVVAT